MGISFSTSILFFRFLGKIFAVVINNFIENGILDNNYVKDNFEYDRWKKGDNVPAKENIVQDLSSFLLSQVYNFINTLDLDWLIANQLKQFLKLRSFLMKCSKSCTELILNDVRKSIDNLLKRYDLSMFFTKYIFHINNSARFIFK